MRGHLGGFHLFMLLHSIAINVLCCVLVHHTLSHGDRASPVLHAPRRDACCGWGHWREAKCSWSKRSSLLWSQGVYPSWPLSAGPETEHHAHWWQPQCITARPVTCTSLSQESLNGPGLLVLLRANLVSSEKAAPIPFTEKLPKQNLPGRKKWK